MVARTNAQISLYYADREDGRLYLGSSNLSIFSYKMFSGVEIYLMPPHKQAMTGIVSTINE